MNKLFDKDDVNFFKIVGATAVATIIIVITILQERDMNNEDVKLYAAKATAAILFLGLFCVMLLPWVIPFIWEMPEGMIAPYYGILIMFESLRATQQFGKAKTKNEKKCKGKKKCQN